MGIYLGVEGYKMLLNTNEYDIRFVKWSELSKIMQEIPPNCIADMSVYQTLKYLSITGKGRKFVLSNPWNLKGVRDINIVQYCDKKVCAIAPLLINNNKKEIVLRGHYTTAGQLGFIHTQDWPYEAFCNMIATIQDKYANFSIKFDRIKQDTLCCDYFIKYCDNTNFSITQSPCVSICISDGYEAWFDNLSRSARSNIRNSHNRVKKANISMQLKVSSGGKEKLVNIWNRMCLYSKRMLVKLNYDYGILNTLACYAEAVNKYADPMTKALNRMEESFNAELFFDGKLVAFLSGFIYEGNRLILPRVAIDSEFGTYRPGALLINETIKYLSSDAKELKVEQFDLSRGDEHYKYHYGGETYYNYAFILN